MNRKQRKTLKAVFAEPVLANINWQDIENLFVALGAVVKEGNGSRLRVELSGVIAVFQVVLQKSLPSWYSILSEELKTAQ